MMVAELEHEPGITACIPALSTIIRVGVEDKIQQVLFNAIALLEDVLAATRRAKIPRSVLAPLMDPITADLLEKLSDGNARIREGARKGVEVLAASPNIGPAVLAAHALRQLSAKQKTAWRPIVARLELMTSLVTTYGVGGTTGISADAFMNFAKVNGCFAHSNGEVRDAARDLTVALHKLVGTAALEPYLRTLRPKQLEEYEAAFGGIKTGIVLNDDVKAPSKKASVKEAGGAPQAKGVMSPREEKAAARAAPAKTNTSARQSPAKGKGKGGDETDFTTCMFCGASDSTWTEDALDLHYWKDCSLLAPCSACSQVVEVAGLPEHLLEECEHKAQFRSDPVTGTPSLSSFSLPLI
jgi:centrosomal protein CEP104